MENDQSSKKARLEEIDYVLTQALVPKPLETSKYRYQVETHSTVARVDTCPIHHLLTTERLSVKTCAVEYGCSHMLYSSVPSRFASVELILVRPTPLFLFFVSFFFFFSLLVEVCDDL